MLLDVTKQDYVPSDLETTLAAYGLLLREKVRLRWEHVPICRPFPGQEQMKYHMRTAGVWK